MNHSSRAYSYDNPSGGYSSEQIPHHQSQFPASAQPTSRGYHQPQASGHYYVQGSGNPDGRHSRIPPPRNGVLNSPSATQPDPYFRSMTPMMSPTRSMTPMMSPTHRYSASAQPRYYPSSGGGGSASSSSQVNPSAYPAQSSYYSSQYPREHRPHHSGGPPDGPFIPTPSEIYNNYPPRQISVPPQSPTPAPYSSSQYPPPHSIVPSSRSPEQRPARISTGRPQTSPIIASPISASSPSGERFPCDRCGKTFSRSHDRKRHHETQHLTSPVIHRCRYCEKEFSRYVTLQGQICYSDVKTQ